MKFDLENIGQNSIPFMEDDGNWIFRGENDKLAPVQHQDQIKFLDNEASKFLWDFEMTLNIDCTKKSFNQIEKFDTAYKTEKEIKKDLYNLGIPFKQIVFIAIQPGFGLQLTWKMVIKYSLFYYLGLVLRS